MEEELLKLSLRDGQNALQYVQSLRPEVRQIATEAILECSRLGYPLNNMEITSKAREMQRKRRKVIAWSQLPKSKGYSFSSFFLLVFVMLGALVGVAYFKFQEMKG